MRSELPVPFWHVGVLSAGRGPTWARVWVCRRASVVASASVRSSAQATAMLPRQQDPQERTVTETVRKPSQQLRIDHCAGVQSVHPIKPFLLPSMVVSKRPNACTVLLYGPLPPPLSPDYALRGRHFLDLIVTRCALLICNLYYCTMQL